MKSNGRFRILKQKFYYWKPFIRAYFVVCALLFASNTSYAKEVTIIYTGSTHAMLYPCHCPVEPDGGVARRAALIKELRKAKPDSVLIDSGNFFAGGLMDEYTQNTQLDMARSMVNLKAMRLMNYDAVAVGDNEFNFGKDFFIENVEQEKINVVSCNLKLSGVLPFVIKDIKGIKLALIGVTNLYTKQKASGVDISDPFAAVKETIKAVKEKGADLVVVLSNLNESENMVLVNNIGGIDVLLTIQRPKEEAFVKVGTTLVLFPSWQGRKLGVATLNVENKKIINYKVELLRLSDKVKNDQKVQAGLPRCFSDEDCRQESKVSSCVNPGTMSASCQAVLSNKVQLTVITSKECLACDPQKTIEYFKSVFPGLVVSYLYYPDNEPSRLIKDAGISGLPAFILGKEISNETGYDKIKSAIVQKGDFYLVKPEASGVTYFLDREKKKGSLAIFISLFEKDSSAILEAIRDFNPEVHFLAKENKGGLEAARGLGEVEECLRSVCVKKYYPASFWDYIICRARNIDSSWWENCSGRMDTSKIKACAMGQEGKELLKENISLNGEFQVMFGPAYLIDNNEIFGTQGTPTKEDFKKILRR